MKTVTPIQKAPISNVWAGTPQADTFNGSMYDDEFHGFGGDDVMYGGGGNDKLFGDDGNDTFYGGTGHNILDGGTGNDTFIGGAGEDTISGGGDFDTVTYASAASSVSVVWDEINNRLHGEDGYSTGDVYSSIEKFVGTNFDDRLDVSKYADFNFGGVTLDAGAGNDFLIGGRGDDILTGGAGGDRLDGGNGNDLLTGGTGPEQDLFVFHPHQTGADLVTDFQPGIDKLLFDVPGNPFGSDGELACNYDVWLYVMYTSADGTNGPYNDRLFWDINDYKLYEIDYDGGPGAHGTYTLLGTFTNGVQLHTSDFILA